MGKPMSEVSIQEKIKFIMLVGSAFHRYGASADRLESSLSIVGEKLNVKGSYFSLPTSLMASFKVSADAEENRMERLDPGKINLTKLIAVDQLIDQVAGGKVTVQSGTEKIKAIIDARPAYNGILASFAYGVIATAVCMILQGNFYDRFFSFVFGLFAGLMMATVKKERIDSILDAAIAFLVTFLSYAAYNYGAPINPSLVGISSILFLTPGLMFTTALREIAYQNLTSGTARLTGSLMIMMKLAIGVFLATILASKIGLETDVAVHQLVTKTIYTQSLGVFICSLGLLVGLQARPKDYGWLLLACSFSFFSAEYFSEYLGRIAGLFCAGTLVAALSNLYARFAKSVAMVFLLPAVILLVPGIFGYTAFSLFLEEEMSGGFSKFTTMILLGLALVSGVLTGSILIRPRRLM